ncbi:alkaline phosphatase D family protein [Amycolatopsis speibonae]|uniref:Alkaline phosphatase D family protein n=1 Tax=Amycolatopsis speibonae TaxID=1450224 RepID=A0ABV7NRN7_9PSEU
MSLLLGPLLRHVDEKSATVWVETRAEGEVEVLGTTARTFEIRGHHYALLVLTGLEPGSCVEYEVRVDGEKAWPLEGSAFPPSRIRTLPGNGSRFRLVFGSCRKPHDDDALGPDALAAYARRMADGEEADWPQALLMLGDQVYADETTDETQEWLSRRRDTAEPPGTEVADFEEYTHLYHEAWGEPAIRWLLSTVPTSMIFDDHDVRDDWNTSYTWQRQMRAQPWWKERLRGAIMSYWVYQHLGNLGPAELAEDATFQKAVTSGGDNADLLVSYADEADNERDGTKGARWSYRRDFGTVRLLVIDSRAGRILAGGTRSMVDEDEFDWIEKNAAAPCDHLLIGSSLPWLLPPVVSHLQSLNERSCARPGRRGRFAEKLRQAADLEHWAAFRASFERLAAMIAREGRREDPPATIAVLSGDVHHAYIAEARYPRPVESAVYQLTCSPVHNAMPRPLKPIFAATWSPRLASLARRWATRGGVGPDPVTWAKLSGPHFGNVVATVEATGRTAVTTIEQATVDGLVEVARQRLA